MTTSQLKISATLNLAPARCDMDYLKSKFQEYLDNDEITEIQRNNLVIAISDALDNNEANISELLTQEEALKLISPSKYQYNQTLMYLLGDMTLNNFAQNSELENVQAIYPDHFETEFFDIALVFNIEADDLSQNDKDIILDVIGSQISDGWFENGSTFKTIDMDVREHPVGHSYKKLLRAGFMTLSRHFPKTFSPQGWFDADNNVILSQKDLIKTGIYSMQINAKIDI